MKKILNYGITYMKNGKQYDQTIFQKRELIFQYIYILKSADLDISNLTCYQWAGVRKPEYKDITGEINKFIM